MSLSRVKVWVPGDILTASDLNGEFNNILNNPISLISPTTGAINFNLASHVNLTPSAITASSASDGDTLVRSTTGGTIWFTGARTATLHLTPGAAVFSSASFPTLQKTTDSNFPTYTLLYHSSVKESAYWYVQLTSAITQISSATLVLSVVATSSGANTVWQANTRMANTNSTWNTLGSTDLSSTFTLGVTGDLNLFSIPLTATSWTIPGVLQVRIDRFSTDAGNTSTGNYLHSAAIRIKV